MFGSPKKPSRWSRKLSMIFTASPPASSVKHEHDSIPVYLIDKKYPETELPPPRYTPEEQGPTRVGRATSRSSSSSRSGHASISFLNSFTNLPVEIFLDICELLPYEDLKSLRLACRRLERAANASLFTHLSVPIVVGDNYKYCNKHGWYTATTSSQACPSLPATVNHEKCDWHHHPFSSPRQIRPANAVNPISDPFINGPITRLLPLARHLTIRFESPELPSGVSSAYRTSLCDSLVSFSKRTLPYLLSLCPKVSVLTVSVDTNRWFENSVAVLLRSMCKYTPPATQVAIRLEKHVNITLRGEYAYKEFAKGLEGLNTLVITMEEVSLRGLENMLVKGGLGREIERVIRTCPGMETPRGGVLAGFRQNSLKLQGQGHPPRFHHWNVNTTQYLRLEKFS